MCSSLHVQWCIADLGHAPAASHISGSKFLDVAGQIACTSRRHSGEGGRVKYITVTWQQYACRLHYGSPPAEAGRSRWRHHRSRPLTAHVCFEPTPTSTFFPNQFACSPPSGGWQWCSTSRAILPGGSEHKLATLLCACAVQSAVPQGFMKSGDFDKDGYCPVADYSTGR